MTKEKKVTLHLDQDTQRLFRGQSGKSEKPKQQSPKKSGSGYRRRQRGSKDNSSKGWQKDRGFNKNKGQANDNKGSSGNYKKKFNK